jgi:hypothetical protein
MWRAAVRIELTPHIRVKGVRVERGVDGTRVVKQHGSLLPHRAEVLQAGVMTVTLMEATNSHLNRSGSDMCAAVSQRRVLRQAQAVKLIGTLSVVDGRRCLHHSRCVPGLIAKPIIDILIGTQAGC